MGRKIWGAGAPRRFFGDAHWNEPLVWNDEARASKRRMRVFCASMSDVFERRAELNEWRDRLWLLIEATPWLDWLLLTKRPQNISAMAPWKDSWPNNVWLGTTVENQKYAEERLPYLLAANAAIRFLSCEPLLGPLDLRSWFDRDRLNSIDWIIAGGESGPNCRPMHPDWVTSLLHQCQEADVPFHFKQWGHWVPVEAVNAKSIAKTLKFGKDRPVEMVRLPKKEAGRTLNGATWNGVPFATAVHA
jgi:protein gp37